ncbi:enoyl-ACP reductase FabI [Aquimonas sp.]|jgi:enoyl-[acyl-carrier protein] reductase I|uniref:enoyl-ACP reductase FabI n=1 Tax=Aquimonas sp. TaxID=1872588 RepID=UPI0037BF07FD
MPPPLIEAALIQSRTFDELAIGDSAELCCVLTQRDIDLFAVVSGDVNPAHLDPEFAERSRFHGVIGHGMWGGALISAVLGTRLPGPGTIYLGQELRFKRPVRPGDAITARVTVRELRADKGIAVLDCECVNQFGETVISGSAEVLAPRERIEWNPQRLPSASLHQGGPDPLDLTGKRGLIVGIANDQSIAYGCAVALQAAGAELAITYLNDKAQPHVRPLAESLGAPLILPCDVREPGQLEAVFAAIERDWGRLDFVLHSIAFAPREDLHGRVVDASAAGFAQAMDVSCHSFLRMAKLAEPLMREGGTLLTVTFYGSSRVVEHYNLMGPVKAALESAVRYVAAELGPKGIRAHAISPGPIRTRAASGIDRFDELLADAAARVPARQLADIADVGALARYLVSDAARHITGTVIPVDGGQHLAG